MKTEYRIIRKSGYRFLQHSITINLIFITFIHWKYILNANNPVQSPVRHNKYIADNNTDLNAFMDKYNNVFDYIRKDYPLLKQKSLQEFREFQHEARTSF